MKFDFYRDHFLFYSYPYKIYPNMRMRERRNKIFIFISRSRVSNTLEKEAKVENYYLNVKKKKKKA